MRPIVGITHATGMLYALRLIEAFHQLNAQTCLIMDRNAEASFNQETGYPLAHTQRLVHDFCYHDAAALPYSAQQADAMIIVPCSVAAVAPLVRRSSLNTLQTAAKSTLKQKKKLITVISEPVFLPGQITIMLELAYKGATIMPYMPSFYHNPASIDDLVNHHTGRIFDLLGIEHNLIKRWGED